MIGDPTLKVAALDALLLFLVGTEGKSGYDIRRLFQSSPLGLFSDSPGAIYPALARLEARGLLASRAEATGRRKRTFLRTLRGEGALRAWLRQPIAAEMVSRRLQELDLRFVLTADVLGEEAATGFARQCARAYADEIGRLTAFRAAAAETLTKASLRALDLGMHLLSERLRWCEDLAANTLAQE